MARSCSSPAWRRRSPKSLHLHRANSCGWPGISAIVTPTYRSRASAFASGATTCWRKCSAGSVARSPRSKLRSIRRPPCRIAIRMVTTIRTHIITPIMVITTMTKKKNLPLRGKGERKRSRTLHLPPCGGGRPPAHSDGGREGGVRACTPNSTPLPNPPPQGGREQTGASGGKEAAALYRLMAWLSPSYPVGAFSYSSGIEWAVEAGDITNAATLIDWLSLMMGDGAGFCDAVLFVHAHRAAGGNDAMVLREVAELAAVFSPSKERHLETTAQGRAFIEATKAAWHCDALDLLASAWDGPVAYPV